MPVFSVKVFQRLAGEGAPGEEWSNSFHFDALGGGSAALQGEAVAAALMANASQDVNAYLVTAQEGPGSQVFRRAINIAGEISVIAANLIPLFNTVRLTFQDDVLRSENIYLRGMIGEANVQGYQISGELQTAIQDNTATPILELLGLCGPTGETLTSVATQQVIQMRQLGWHRRTRPGYKRGWVPIPDPS